LSTVKNGHSDIVSAMKMLCIADQNQSRRYTPGKSRITRNQNLQFMVCRDIFEKKLIHHPICLLKLDEVIKEQVSNIFLSA